MATEKSQIEIEITAKTSAYRAELAKIPGMTEAQATKAAEGMRKSLWVAAAKDAAGLTNKVKQEAEAQAKAMERTASEMARANATAAKAADQAWGKAGSAIKGVLSQIGGTAAQIGNLVFEIGGHAAGAAGAVGLGAAAVGALGLAVKGVADEALAARDRLIETGRAAEISPEALASLDFYAARMADLRAEADGLKVALGSEVAATITGAADVATDAAASFSGWNDEISLANQGMSLLNAVLHPTTGAMKLAIYAANQHGHELANAEAAANDYTEQMRALGLVEEDAVVDAEHQAALLRETIEERRKATAEQRAATDAAREAASERAKLIALNEQDLKQIEAAKKKRADAANAEIAEIGRLREAAEMRSAAAESRDELVAATTDLADRMTEYSGSWDHVTAVVQQVAEDMAPIVSQVADIADTVTQMIEDAAERQIDALGESAEAQVQAASDAADAWREQQEELIAGQLEAGEIDQATADAKLALMEGQFEAYKARAESQAEDERKRAGELFRQQQKLALAMVPVHVAQGLLMSTATLGPPVPPNFVGIAGAAAVIATGIAEGLSIANASPPAFPTGGLTSTRGGPDHRNLIATQDNEFVVNQRGVSAAGMDALSRLNEGRGGMGQQVNITLNRRIIASAIVDASGRANLDPRAGVRNPFGRR
jgi:hypothetical protein